MNQSKQDDGLPCFSFFLDGLSTYILLYLLSQIFLMPLKSLRTMLAAVRAGNRFLMGTNAFRLPASSSRCIHMAPKLPMGEHAGFTFAHSYRCYSAGLAT